MSSQLSLEVALRVEGLHHTHEHGTGWVLEDLALEVRRGELVHLKGDTGSGKSTLLKLLAGRTRPVRGTIEVCGAPLGTGPRAGRHRLVLVPDVLRPSGWLGPREYLHLRARWRGQEPLPTTEELDQTLEAWGLTSLAERPISTLSHGECRRVVLASAFLSRPDVLLLDEPLNGLDRRHRELAAEQLLDAAAEVAVLVTTHVERSDLPGARRTLLLEGGRLHTVEARGGA